MVNLKCAKCLKTIRKKQLKVRIYPKTSLLHKHLYAHESCQKTFTIKLK